MKDSPLIKTIDSFGRLIHLDLVEDNTATGFPPTQFEREIVRIFKEHAQQAEEIRLLTDRLAVYDATDIPKTIAENQRLRELLNRLSKKYVFDMLKDDRDEIVPLIEQSLKGRE